MSTRARDTAEAGAEAWQVTHVPGTPAAVALKFTSMTWTGDGRLVLLAQTANHDVVAVWRPGQKRLAVRSVELPERTSGSDSFVAWSVG